MKINAGNMITKQPAVIMVRPAEAMGLIKIPLTSSMTTFSRTSHALIMKHTLKGRPKREKAKT